ncbi:MAG: class I SAM-dependent methyltransferase, partial [Acidobacteriota bacterium]|nr:class I SAM-dependent methyltransferase [Acidobacteriota bacterium]
MWTSDEAYDRFMGRFSRKLAPVFADFAGIERDMRVLDVGAGTGALTAELVRRDVASAAIEPSPQFVAALRRRFPAVDVREGAAEELPWRDDSFDVALAQLVVSFMRDAPAGVREMLR